MARWLRSFVVVVLAILLLPMTVESKVWRYKFHVVMKNFTRLCESKPIVTVDGKFPGPTLYAREDDTVVVRVVNNVSYNITIHWYDSIDSEFHAPEAVLKPILPTPRNRFVDEPVVFRTTSLYQILIPLMQSDSVPNWHGIRQLRSGWSDGPAYVTQCPIKTGESYLYKFNVTGQRGTLFWHAHITWLRATVHGAIVILPKLGVPYPFPKPDHEKIIIFGEWWKSDVNAVMNQWMQTGMPPNVSDAHTINGYPGPAPNCSTSKGYTLHVEAGKTYLLRIINAALNEDLFFKIAKHRFTVVDVDACYVKPFETDTIYIAPGQTTNALLTADQRSGKYLMAIAPFMDTVVAVDNQTATSILRYKTTEPYKPTTLTALPATNATPVTNAFGDSLRSLNSPKYPALVPLEIDHSLLFVVGVGVNNCSTCVNASRVVAGINNITFVMPDTALLQAHYYNIRGVFTEDFPGNPVTPYNYTANNSLTNMQITNGTKVYPLTYNSTVQVVIQGNAVIAPESHPIHLHGYNFYIVGKGTGNYDPVNDPKKFNLVDPVERNTLNVPTAGWTAIRFRADNPGVWFMHCHLEVHTTWGLKMAFLVKNGKGPNESIIPPPKDLPTC